MSQVTIYLEPETLELAKACAARAQLSVSKWFAQKVEAERAQLQADRTAFWQTIDMLREGANDDGMDFVLDSQLRHADLGQDIPCPSFD